MKFTWKCPKCKEDNESEFKNIRQCQCGKCGFISVFRESDADERKRRAVVYADGAG